MYLGSTTIGNNVHVGGQVGIAQHLKIGDNVRIAAKSGVMNNLPANSTFGTIFFDYLKFILEYLVTVTDILKIH